MKHVVFGFVLFLFLISAVSCLSTPETPAAKKTAAIEPVAAVAPSDSTISGETVQAADSVQPVDAPLSTGETASPETAMPADALNADASSAEIPQTDVLDAVPPLPSSERLLYFYPEPDPLYVAPIAPVASEKPAPQVSKPPKTATKSDVKPAEKATAKPAEPVTEKKPAVAATEKKPADAKSSGEEKSPDVMPGIWTAEPVAPSIMASAKNAAPPSRKAALSVGQTLEVWYPGSGWVYLGDVSAQNGLGYENRKLDKADTLFTFKALKPGDYILEFTRFDVLEDSYSSDTIAVSVTDDGTRKTGKIHAPDYRSAGGTPASTPATANATETNAVPAAGSATIAPATRANVPTVVPLSPIVGKTSSALMDEPSLMSASPTQVVTATGASVPSDAAALLAKAKASLASGDAATALSTLENFFSVAVDSLDEGWYLRGQAYEANGPMRDIRKALASYQTLVSAWPESSRWNEADTRIRYIKQFYLGR